MPKRNKHSDGAADVRPADVRLTCVADQIRCALAHGPVTGAKLFFDDCNPVSSFVDAIVTLVQTGEVVREYDAARDAYTYRLAAPPPLPPLPTVTQEEIALLHLVHDNEPFLVNGMVNAHGVWRTARMGLTEKGLIGSPHSWYDGYRLTDLGRRVLEANR